MASAKVVQSGQTFDISIYVGVKTRDGSSAASWRTRSTDAGGFGAARDAETRWRRRAFASTEAARLGTNRVQRDGDLDDLHADRNLHDDSSYHCTSQELYKARNTTSHLADLDDGARLRHHVLAFPHLTFLLCHRRIDAWHI